MRPPQAKKLTAKKSDVSARKLKYHYSHRLATEILRIQIDNTGS
jgi:hypothetical protein